MTKKEDLSHLRMIRMSINDFINLRKAAIDTNNLENFKLWLKGKRVIIERERSEAYE